MCCAAVIEEIACSGVSLSSGRSLHSSGCGVVFTPLCAVEPVRSPFSGNSACVQEPDALEEECGSAIDHLRELSRWDAGRSDLFTALCDVRRPPYPPYILVWHYSNRLCGCTSSSSSSVLVGVQSSHGIVASALESAQKGSLCTSRAY